MTFTRPDLPIGSPYPGYLTHTRGSDMYSTRKRCNPAMSPEDNFLATNDNVEILPYTIQTLHNGQTLL